MIKQPSQANVKRKSREKSKSKPTNSRSKLQPFPHKTLQLERNINNEAKSKPKTAKNAKKLKIQHFKPEATASRLKNQNKQQTDNYGLHMKAELKHLISKNNPAKPKNTDIVPELLKNIQKNCKALKNIHHKQCQLQQKRSSQHSNKAHNLKRNTVQYKKSEQRTKLKQSLQKDGYSNELVAPKITRFSLEISQGDAEKLKIEQKLRENQVRKSAETCENQKNFVQLFKLYKKSFEIEEFKIEKSNRKTNYNTNQSRNSSSHHNSHGHSRVGDYNLRGKSREEEKLNIQKIECLIKSQQKNLQKENIDRNLVQILTVRDNRDISIGQELLKKNISEINQLKINQSLKDEKFINFSDNFVINTDKADFNIKQAAKHVYIEQQPQNMQTKELQESQLQQKDVQSVKEAEVEKQSEQLVQKKFQKSKFYVQPIPKFDARKKEPDEDEDLSLLGCEITLIQNNIVLEDSELVSLQL